MLNKVILMGRLTKEPEIRYTTTSNIPVCGFTLAVDRRFARQGEEKQTDFIPIVAWNKLAEFCGRYFRKGQQIAVVGRIQTRTWEDTEGKRHYATEVVAEEVYFAGGGKKETQQSTQQDKQEQYDDGFYSADDDDELPF